MNNVVLRRYWSILLVSLLLSCSPPGRTGSVQKEKGRPGNYQVYLLMGQSNMAGRGILTGEYTGIRAERVLMLDRENEWVPARHPLHFDKPKVAGVGPGLSFGAALAKVYSKDTIGLVPCAVGGTAISKWEPGAFDEVTRTHPYDDAILRLKAARKRGVIKGVIWLQGEGDSNPVSAKKYLARLTALIERIRKEAGDPELPFVVGELGRYRTQYRLVNEQLALLPKTVPFTLVVSSEGLVHKGDTTHFDSPSATEYGRRFAAGMLLLQKR
ncbi:sialate O-acetylesterase [Niabella drilacis]|nr:sialate O-acetylesterase [Niabella drilacis]